MERREFLKKTLAAGTAAAVAGAILSGRKSVAAEKSTKPQKILILTGSPRKGGNSAILADSFAKGAQEAGHTVGAVNGTEYPEQACKLGRNI